MLPGIKVRDLNKNIDERGYFAELVKNDWTDFLESELPQQVNLSVSFPGMIRAWHHHVRGQVDYFMVVSGSVKIVAFDDTPGSPTKGQLTELIVSGERLQLVRIPGIYWHGTKALGNTASFTVYAVSRMYDVKNPDEGRKVWNDPSIVDPRTNQPYDWNKPPHK